MKYRNLFIMAVATATLMTYGCDKNEVTQTTPTLLGQNRETVTLHATIDRNDTKAYIGDDKYLYWQDGDKVWINGAEYTLTVDGDNATIENVVAADEYVAIYPASMAGGYYNEEDNRNVYIDFPAIQEYKTIDGKQVVSIPISAYSTTNSLTFYNCASLFRVNMTNDKGKAMNLESITVTPESTVQNVDIFFSGRTGIYAGEHSAAYGFAMMNGGDVTLSFADWDEQLAINATKSYYIAVPMFGFAKLTVAVNATDSEEKIYTFCKQTASAKELSVNEIGDIPISMKDLKEDWAAYFPVGSGTENDPYIINSKTQLVRLKELVDASKPMNSSWYKLGSDIDFGGDTFYSIGIFDRPFYGHFDGDNHIISNMVLGRRVYSNGKEDYSIRGLFGYAVGATFKNVTVNATATLSEYTRWAAIFCAAQCGSAFSGITTTGSIVTQSGGGIERCAGLLANSIYDANNDLTVTDCTNKATITVSSTKENPCVGGIIGRTQNLATVTGCTNEGNISLTNPSGSASKSSVGGIIGKIIPDYSKRSMRYEHFVVDRCRNKGLIQVQADEDCCAGGLAGMVEDFNLNSEESYDVVLRVSNFVNKGKIIACSTDEDDAWAGGAVGYMDSDGTDISGDEFGPYFYNCLNDNEISSTGDYARSGGICGYVKDDDTNFILCVNVGSCKGSGNPHNGAISGGTYDLLGIDDGGTAYYCYWDISGMPCIYDDDDGDGGCLYDEYFTSGWLNNRRLESGLVKKSIWTAEQWAGTSDGIHACTWIGSSDSKLDPNYTRPLDLDF